MGDDLTSAEKAWMDRVDEAWHESMGSPDSLGTRMRWFLAGYETAMRSQGVRVSTTVIPPWCEHDKPRAMCVECVPAPACESDGTDG